MAGVDIRDIFDAVYFNVKNIILSRDDVTKIKIKTVSQNANEEGTRSTTTMSEPVSEARSETLESSGSSTETVREYVEKGDVDKRVLEIRADLEEKFPFALGAVCSNLASLDRAYRKFKGYAAQSDFSHYFIDLNDEFPLSDRFIHSCIVFVSSMVIIDIDDKKSDDFYEKYACAVSSIQAEIPFESVLTAEKYPY